MKEVKSWIEKNHRTNSGVSSVKIASLEHELKQNLPKAYKEFLSLTGEEFIPLIIGHGFK